MPSGMDGCENRIYCDLPSTTWDFYHRLMRPWNLLLSYVSKDPGEFTSVGDIACSFDCYTGSSIMAGVQAIGCTRCTRYIRN